MSSIWTRFRSSTALDSKGRDVRNGKPLPPHVGNLARSFEILGRELSGAPVQGTPEALHMDIMEAVRQATKPVPHKYDGATFLRTLIPAAGLALMVWAAFRFAGQGERSDPIAFTAISATLEHSQAAGEGIALACLEPLKIEQANLNRDLGRFARQVLSSLPWEQDSE